MPTGASNIIRVYEQQELYLGEVLSNGIQVDQALLQLFQRAATSPLHKCFRVSHQSIRFQQYVGLFQLGPYTIEVLPKLDQVDEEDNSHWSRFLVDLIRATQALPLLSSGWSGQSSGTSFLADLLAESFIYHLDLIVRKGLLQHYISVQRKDSRPKGTILWPQQSRSPLRVPPLLIQSVRRRNLSHPYNGWLAAALVLLQRWNLRSNLQLRLRELASVFPPPVWPDPPALHAQHQLRGAAGQLYRPALQIAMHLLRSQGHRLRAGKLRAPSVLFDMNVLFESYIFQQLQKHLPKGARIQRQAQQVFWRKQKVQPDILLWLSGKPYILDTKWKILPSSSPSANDLRQLYVYQRVFGASRGVLIYPRVENLAWRAAYPYHSVIEEPLVYDAQLLFVSVVKDGQINDQLGAEIIVGLQDH